MEKWRPLSKRDDESYDALHEGVPAWLVASLLNFVNGGLKFFDPVMGMSYPNGEKLLAVERKLRVALDWSPVGAESALASIRRHIDDRTFFLDLVDYLLLDLVAGSSEADALEVQLKEGGSAWSVQYSKGDRHYHLVRRLDDTVVTAARRVMDASGRAGQHLAKAWSEMYGRHPDPSTAYREAVRAVEAVGIPVISPNNRTATLGTMIADMKNAPAKWSVTLKPKTGDPVLMIRESMELLWTAELDRHGTADEKMPLHVSSEEAGAALHLAVTLVHWFQSGAIKARGSAGRNASKATP